MTGTPDWLRRLIDDVTGDDQMSGVPRYRHRYDGNHHTFAAVLDRTLAENDRLRAALVDARDELKHWGWGDHHYGEQPQEQRVVDVIERINRVLNPS